MMHFLIGLGICAWLILLWVLAVWLGKLVADYLTLVLP